MINQYKGKNNPRVIVIQKLYGKFFNKDEIITFPKHPVLFLQLGNILRPGAHHNKYQLRVL